MRTDITFDSAGLKLAGHLYLPAGEATGPRPAIVVGHPASGVKEQAAGLYAERLARAGFVALAFDAAYQGESEGLPRGLEDPAHRVEDLKAAVSFLSARDEVDPDRIGALGICASGGYVIPAAATDHRIKVVATVSAVDIGRQFREGADGHQDPAVIQGMLDAAAAARTAEARGSGVGVFPLFPATEEEARAGGQHAYEGWQYYCTDRAQHPRSAKSFTWTSVDHIAQFDAFRFIDLIAPRPLLMILGREAITSWMATEAFAQASDPKQLFWIDGASHVALYDEDKYVSPAITKLTEFFHQHLTADGIS
ncbi:alpha/beta hydrolase [Streptomyces sp. SID13031]|uniref:alpha/beta hydrolase n=1 Tax=Streptomyces sp. SID13031 TaxID=2706046 RepID=UPI0013CD6BD7|nr:alpha/beta hydrolase [Streptomyces sp. SID13031]NEA32921.1 alpha/beta hydrolase [Streptomyces sp. SID13031]